MTTEKKKDQKQSSSFETTYQVIVKKELTTLQALYEMFDQKRSIKKIKEGLQSLKRTEKNIEQMKWKQKKNKSEFIKICESLQKYFDEDREKSMRSTEKNINEMNEQVSRMRKSLSQKGILLHFKDEVQNEQQNIMRAKQQIKGQKQLEKKIEFKKQIEQKEQHQSKREEGNEVEQQNLLNRAEEENQIQGQSNKNENAINTQVNQSSKNKNSNPIIDDNPEDEQKKQEIQTLIKQQRIVKQDKTQQNVKHNQTRNLKIQSHVAETSINSSSNSPTDKQRNQIIQTLKKHKEQKEPIQWIELANAGSPILSNGRKQLKKLKTLPEELDNEFYDQQMTQLKQSRKEKYNPKAQIEKKLSKKRHIYPSPRNQLQQAYYKAKKKLSQLFSHFLKGLKTNSFTFDAIPQSLDIKTFSSHFQQFKLNEFFKVVDIPRLFKRYSVNGTWLSQQGFFMIHFKIFGIPENVQAEITSLANNLEKLEHSFNLINQSEAQQQQKKQSEKRIVNEKAAIQKRSSELLEKISKLNIVFPEAQVNKLTRKIQKKSHNSEQIRGQYDVSQLKRIVEIHSGIYKQDIIQKLGDRKRQNEIKHQTHMQKILQKYKAKNINIQPSSEGNSRVNVNKNNQSTPNLHRIEGYSKRNKLIKFGEPTDDLMFKRGLSKETETKPISLSMNKQPYFVPSQQKGEGKDQKNQGIRNSGGPAQNQKTELLKQLSLPKLPKRKMRQQSIYESLRLIDAKAELQFIKKLVTSGAKEQEKIFEEFYSKERQILDKEKWKKPTVQNSMKFS